jgi:hypothetical protein
MWDRLSAGLGGQFDPFVNSDNKEQSAVVATT